MEREPADLLAEGLESLELRLGAAAQRQLLDLARLLGQWAQRFNLTSHRTPQAIVRRLVLDALALTECLPAAQRVVDLGSGAGFPGLPLAVRRPSTRVVLVEARERRHHFQKTAIRELGLTNVEARHGRIEELEPIPSGGVVAQALSQPSRAVALSLPWCEAGGWIAVPGAETPPEPDPISGVARPEVRRYQVPCGGPQRTLWIGWRD